MEGPYRKNGLQLFNIGIPQSKKTDPDNCKWISVVYFYVRYAECFDAIFHVLHIMQNGC